MSMKSITDATCILIGAGDEPKQSIHVGEQDYLIAVDGGYGYCVKKHLEPDFILGDFDSLEEKYRNALQVERTSEGYSNVTGTSEGYSNVAKHVTRAAEYDGNVTEEEMPLDRIRILPVCKDDTDMLAAVKHGFSLGYRNFALYGGCGGRLDHTLANIQTLLYIKNHGGQGTLYSNQEKMFVICEETVCLEEQKDGFFSLFALQKEVRGVTIEGLKYEINRANLTNDFPIGVSNEFVGKKVKITVEQGALLAVIQNI